MQTSIAVENGLFNAVIGSVTVLNLSFDKPYYLGLKVASDPEMKPLQKLTSVGSAFRAITAENLSCSGCITRTMIASGVTLPPDSHTHSAVDMTTGTVSDSLIPSTIARATDLTVTASALITHTSSSSNPHATTAAQVGAVNKSGDTMTGALTVPSISSIGSGTVGWFENTDPGSAVSAMYIKTNGLSHSLYSENTGSHCAAHFMATNPNNQAAGIYSETDGLGPAGIFRVNNAFNLSKGLNAYTNGLGNAGWFEIFNTASPANTLYSKTNGTGYAGYFTGGAGLYVVGNITATGSVTAGSLNADKIDGYDAGNASGNIPVSNGAVNTSLNADMLDGLHASAIKPIIVYSSSSAVIYLTDACANLMSVPITTPATGTIVVEGVVNLYGSHTNGTTDDTSIGVGTTTTTCTNAGYHRIPGAYPTTGFYEQIRFRQVFTNVGAGSMTYYVNGYQYQGYAASTEYMSGGNTTITFFPN